MTYGASPSNDTDAEVLRSVVGAVEASPAGNLILRVGRETSPRGPWLQAERVVMSREEAISFAADVLATVNAGAQYKRWTITLNEGEESERAIDVLTANSYEHDVFMESLVGEVNLDLCSAIGETTNEIPASWKESR